MCHSLEQSTKAKMFIPTENCGSSAILALAVIFICVILRFWKNQPPQVKRKSKDNYEIPDNITSLFECLSVGKMKSNDGPCIGCRGYKEYYWLNYSAVIERATHFVSGLSSFNLKPGSFVGLYGRSGMQSVIAEYGCYSQNMVVVPLEDDMGLPSIRYILEQTELSLAICDTEDRIVKLLEDSCPSLKTIVHFDYMPRAIQLLAKERGVRIISFEEVEALGRKCNHKPEPIEKSDLAAVCYTFDNAGKPIGVKLTHENIISSAIMLIRKAGLDSEDRMLSQLPIAQSFERCGQLALFICGGSVAFQKHAHTNVIKLSECVDVKLVNPTVAFLTPFMLNRLYKRLSKWAYVNHNILNFVLKRKIRAIKYNHFNYIPRFIENLTFESIRKQFGKNLRLMIVGPSPVDSKILSFFRCTLDCEVLQGYGKTECVSLSTLSLSDNHEFDHIGLPLPKCVVKLVDVPELGYLSDNGAGEICIKGPHVFSGYFKEDAKTSEVLDEFGWFHSGDIGEWLPHGNLTIHGNKDVLKLPDGRHVFPERIEKPYNCCLSVNEVFVFGKSGKNSLIAFVHICPDIMWKRSLKFLCYDANRDETMKTSILKKLIAEGRRVGLSDYEQVKGVVVMSLELNSEEPIHALISKLKRKKCEMVYKKEIDEAFEKLY